MLIKLNLSNYFDKLSWSCLYPIIQAFSFSRDLLNWLVYLVSYPFFSILLDGVPTYNFSHSRGI